MEACSNPSAFDINLKVRSLRASKGEPEIKQYSNELWDHVLDDTRTFAEALYSERASTAILLGHNVRSFGYELKFLEHSLLIRNISFIEDMRQQMHRCNIDIAISEWILENFRLCFNGKVTPEDGFAFAGCSIILLENMSTFKDDPKYRTAALELIATFPNIEGMFFATLSAEFVNRLNIFHGLNDFSKRAILISDTNPSGSLGR